MTIETKKVASANEAIEIINRLNYRHDTFCYTSTTREDNADIKYRHFDAYRQNGEKDSFAITEIVVNGKLEVVRFFNLFRDITVDLKLGDFNPDYSRYDEVINVENESATENEAAKENDSKMTIEITFAANNRLQIKLNGKRIAFSKISEMFQYSLNNLEAVIIGGRKYTNFGFGSAINKHPLIHDDYAFVDESGDYFNANTVGSIVEMTRYSHAPRNYFADKAKQDAKKANVEENDNSENNAELVNQLKTFSAKVRGLSCEEFLAENAGLSIAEYREQKATAENGIAKLEIEFKIEDIKSEIGRLESENYYTARNLYSVVCLEKSYATDESLQAYAAELVDEFNDRLGKINEAQAKLATLAPATADAENGNEPTAAEVNVAPSEVPNATEVARFQKGKTYRYYDANTGKPLWYITIDKRTNTTVTVSGEKFTVFIQNHDRFLNYNKPTESFIRGNYRIDATDACEESADEITPATLQKFIEAKKEVSYWRNSNGARIWQIAYIRYGVNGGIVGQTPWLNRTIKEADRYLKDEYGMTLLEYLAAEDKWNDTDKGAILKDKIERDCKPSVDELPALYPADDGDDDGELIDPPEIEFNEHIFIGQDGTNFIIRAKNLNITVEDRKIKINGHIVAKYKTDAGVAAALKYVTDWRNNIANYKTFDINDWNTVFDDLDFAGGNEDKFVYIDDEPPVTSKTITPDEMLAIIDTLDTVNAAAPYGWQIEFDGKNFPIEFNGKLVTTLDSLALAKALPPERFFEQFAPDVSPKERYINDRNKELDMLLDFRKFVEDDPDRLNTLANLIEDVKREILNAELDTEHPPDIEFDEHGDVIPWF